MKIFNIWKEEDRELIVKGWGHERILTNSEKYCGKEMLLYKDKRCSVHYHRLKTEHFLVVSGSMFVELYDKPFEIPEGEDYWSVVDKLTYEGKLQWRGAQMYAGDSILVSPLIPHRFIGIEEETKFIEFSTQDFADDSYRIYPGDSQNV